MAEAMDMALTSSMSVGKRSIISTILEVCPMFRLRGTRHMCVFRAVVLQHFKMLFRLARRLGAWPNRESIAILLVVRAFCPRI